MSAPEVVARLTSENRVHELLRDAGQYVIVTSIDGRTVAMRTLTADQAMEWVDTVRRGGGVVFARGAA